MPLHFNGCSAHITCDGTELEIFSAQEEDETVATGWIASEVLKVRYGTSRNHCYTSVLCMGRPGALLSSR